MASFVLVKKWQRSQGYFPMGTIEKQLNAKQLATGGH